MSNIAARLERLPPSRSLRNIVLRISAGAWFELYDLFMTAYIALGLVKDGIFEAATPNPFVVNSLASFVASGFAGMFVGTILFSWISDHYGRKATFVYALAWYSFANFIMAFAHGAAAIDFWRFIAGIGIGVQLITVDTYICEFTPKNMRGRAIALSQFIGYTSVPVAALLSYVLVPHTIAGVSGWRFVALVGSLGIVAMWFIRGGLPESPRWHESRGRTHDAEAAMSSLERAVTSETGSELPATQAATPTQARGSWRDMWKPPYRKRTITMIAFNATQTFGFYGFASWVPILLANEGVSIVHSLLYTFLIALVNPIGPLLGMRYADRWERRWQLVVLATAIAVFGLIFAHVRAPALIILMGTLITLSNGLFSVAQHAYQAELFPTAIRARATGFVYSWSRCASIFVSFVIGAVLARYGTSGVFIVIAAAMAVVVIVIGGFGTSTRGLSLEELAGVANAEPVTRRRLRGNERLEIVVRFLHSVEQVRLRRPSEFFFGQRRIELRVARITRAFRRMRDRCFESADLHERSIDLIHARFDIRSDHVAAAAAVIER